MCAEKEMKPGEAPCAITFGTDGWRALIDRDFEPVTVARAADAIARIFLEDNPDGAHIVVGHDTRRKGDEFARLVASTLAGHGLHVTLTDRFIPTPTLCWTIAHRDDIDGGVMLNASHNPAEYLGIKIRMRDGGASPVTFTRRVEAALEDAPTGAEGSFEIVDLIDPYLDNLISLVDGPLIKQAGLSVVVDPLYGAARGYLAEALRRLGVTVTEIHGEEDSTFGGLHPEPIEPWVNGAAQAVVESGFDAGFITDGDSDRLGAVDRQGDFVNPHRIFTLVIRHLARDLNKTGRVVRTLSGSELIARQCEAYGLDLVTTPIGFKWIYEEMKSGGVLVGGEESGGIGVPTHVMERDALYIALLLLEMMAMRGKDLGALVVEALDDLGRLEYRRRDLKITQKQHHAFLSADFQEQAIAGTSVSQIITTDGVKFVLEDGSWLLLRASGTEPLIRVYAEAPTFTRVEELLDAGCALVKEA